MERYEITTDRRHLSLVKHFIEAYNNPLFNNFDKKYVVASFSGEDKSNNKDCSIFLRCLIEKDVGAESKHQYIIGLRFYHFGSVATVDFISFSEDYDEIYSKYHTAMGWPILTARVTTCNLFGWGKKETVSPFLSETGYLQIKKDYELLSGVHNRILFFNASDLAHIVLSLNEIVSPVKKMGYDPIQRMLELMYDLSGNEDFYKKVVEETYLYTLFGYRPLSDRHLGSILMMKSLDRLTEDGKEINNNNIHKEIKINNNEIKKIARKKK